MTYKLLFAADNGTLGYELWTTDTSGSSATLVRDIYDGNGYGLPYTSFAMLEGRMIFAAEDGTAGAEIWLSDGTEMGTRLLKDIRFGPDGGSPYTFLTVGETSISAPIPMPMATSCGRPTARRRAPFW